MTPCWRLAISAISLICLEEHVSGRCGGRRSRTAAPFVHKPALGACFCTNVPWWRRGRVHSQAMSDFGSPVQQQASDAFGATRVSATTIFGQVMFLVGVTLGFLAIGLYIGRDLALGTAQALSFVAVGMLFAQSFVAKLRYGSVGIGWLLAIGLIMGFGLGPVLSYYLEAQPDAFVQAAGGTALIVLIMGAWGLATSKDLASWIRPLSFAMLGLFVVSLIGLFFAPGISANPIFSLLVIAVSSGLLVVYFNYLRKHADEDDVVWLATGIFVAIVNLFISLLNLFSSR